MEERDRLVRKRVYDFFLERSVPPVAEELASGLDAPVEEIRESLERLDSLHQLKLVEGTARILMAWPFSGVATPYRVYRTDGRRYFANCAWDAVAFHVMLGEEVRIDSFCAHCTVPIEFRVRDGRATFSNGAPPVVYLGLPAAEWWKDIVRTCSNTMVFFHSQDHFTAWRAATPAASGRALTIEQIAVVSVPIYGGRLRLDYDRPAASTLRRAYETAGLVEPFWTI